MKGESVTGLKKILSSCLGQEDSPAGQETFLAHLLITGPSPRQAIFRYNPKKQAGFQILF